jgi:hypothetical protein
VRLVVMLVPTPELVFCAPWGRLRADCPQIAQHQTPGNELYWVVRYCPAGQYVSMGAEVTSIPTDPDSSVADEPYRPDL